MKIDENDMRPIWLNDKDESVVNIIDQRLLPHKYVISELRTVDETITAIKTMAVRGAPLIGATGAYGVYLATLNCPSKEITETYLKQECDKLKASRPTAVNLAWAVDLVLKQILKESGSFEKIKTAKKMAEKVTDGEALNSKKIGEFGVTLIEEISRAKNGETVNILTHCNAGWLACIGYGTATAPVYEAFNRGIDVHVWVDETRPLNQGARLTAWELGKYGVKHTVITDNAGGHLMQHKMVDIVITGTDRTTYTGDVANKIGTYLKALAARDNNIPFYVALPSSTFDWTLKNGVKDIPIEVRDPDEIRYIQGSLNNKIENVLVPPIDSPAGNYAFDVTPARLVTGFITERGLCKANEKSILGLFPEKKQKGKKMLNELEKKVIAAIQGDIPITKNPYAVLADALNISEDEFLETLEGLSNRGIIRRFGATLRHQKSGFKANAMIAWQANERDIEQIGRKMSSFKEVSHCYRRNPVPDWPYNIYTMVHAKSEEECYETARRISSETELDKYTLLFSKKELKKTSMKYFSDII